MQKISLHALAAMSSVYWSVLLTARQRSRNLLNDFLQAIEKPIVCEGIEVVTTASIGIAVYPNDGETANTLLQNADIAMYQAKARGRNVHAFFDRALDESVRQSRELELDLQCAIRNGQIIPFYQPIISFATGGIAGVEALARWQHPTKGLIGPDKFISLAEDTGQVSDLFVAILKKACLDARGWGSITVAVNVSPTQFSDLGLVGQIFQVLKETGFPIASLDLEVTESAVLDNNKAKAVLGILKRNGARISLDDFGTGYASLSCLNDLPFDKIKIDRSFLRARERSSKNERLVASIISLSHTLGLTTIAEGVESTEDAAWLIRNNCEFGQGYYFSPPVSAEQLSGLLKMAPQWPGAVLRSKGRIA